MQTLAIVSAASQSSALLALVPDQIPDVMGWKENLVELLNGTGPRMARVYALAEKRGVPWKTVFKKLRALEEGGVTGLIDKRNNAKLWASRQPVGLPEADIQQVQQWCSIYQRSSEAGINAMRRAWHEQKVPVEAASHGLSVPQTAQPIDIRTGYPVGWSVRNLMTYAPSEYALKAVRIGRSAAASLRPLVYTTRRGMYVGQFRQHDDFWHDHEVVDFDQRKRGRPLEFHGLDVASGCKIAWGMRTRTQREDGSHDGLESGDFRFYMASLYATQGYHPDGTTEIVENGTAAIPEWMERLLSDATGGAIKVNRAGMTGATAHAGQYAGRAKGNFRLKAALESLGNLIHNEFAALPGQVGRNRDNCPEQMHDGGRLVDGNGMPIGSALGGRLEDSRSGAAIRATGLLKHQDALLAAVSMLPPERALWLQHKLCLMHQFRLIAEEVYARINAREDHDLEGWDERYVWNPRTGKMRKMSPREVYVPGARAMQPLDLATIALILAGGDGLAKLGVERTTRRGMFSLNDGELSGDELRFDATSLPDREKFLTMLNPFDSARLFVFGANGGFIAAVKRIHSVQRADVEALHARMGEAAKTEAALLQPLRIQQFAAAKAKLDRHRNNAAILSEPSRPSRLPDADALDEVADAGSAPRAEDSADSLADEIADML